MLDTIWNIVKMPYVWAKQGWNWFYNKVAEITPGLKTKITTGLGSLGSFAVLAQEYVTGLPLDKFITGTQILIMTAVLFTLSFWFRGMAKS